MSETAFIIHRVAAAQRPEDVFEVDTAAASEEQLAQLKKSFRQLARAVHPDQNSDEGAAGAFICLEQLYEEARAAIGRGRYGRPAPAPAPLRTRRWQAARQSTSFGRYKVVDQLGQDEIADLFLTEASGERYQVKLARRSADNALLEHEAEALRLLGDEDAAEARLQPYVPAMVDTFTHRGSAVLRANVFEQPDGFYSLEEVRSAYPAGVHWRDMAWIFRRLLVAVGFAHANGLVHGAVLPEQVLIHPTDHGLILSDWCRHAQAGTPIETLVAGYENWYPPEVAAKEPASPDTDIFLAARCAQYLLGADAPSWQLPATPARLRAFLEGCASKARASRPDDAWELLREFDELLGPREYRPLSMPPRDGSFSFTKPSSSGPSAATPTNRRSE